MSESTKIKGLFAGVSSVLSYLYGCISSVVVVLVIMLLLDYVTGIAVALRSGNFDRKKGIDGMIKKLSYIILIMIAFLADFTITESSRYVGIDFNTVGILGVTVTMYLIATEALSSLNNLIVLGVPVPKFLLKVFGRLRDEVEKKDGV